MNNFFKNFDQYQLKEWNKKIVSEFGVDKYNDLIKKNQDIHISPIYYQNKLESNPIFPNEIKNLQLIDATNPKIANQKALVALDTGIDGICFSNPNNLNVLLKDIKTEYIKTNFINFKSSFLKELKEYSKKDMISGGISENKDQNFKNLKEIIHVEGGNIKNQINYALAEGLKKENEIEFHFELGNNFFFEIAKLRAFRILWNSKSGKNPYINTSISKKVKNSGLNNIFISTTEYMSAILGGADAIFSKAHNFDYEKSDDFSDRISRNQFNILINESNLDKVKDPAKGSYYIEYLTSELLKDYKINFTNKKQASNDFIQTAEQIQLKKVYNLKDIKEVEHMNFIAGSPPFLRGPYSTMYTTRPWTIRQYAGFSTAKESNNFYKKNLKAGQKGLSVAFDLATHRGYDSDHKRVEGDVGMAGVAIDTVEDMKILFQGIPLDEISVSMTMNGAVLPILAFYIVAAQEQGADPNQLRGTIQNDILKEFMVRNTYIYPPNHSMRIVRDIFEYTSKKMEKFNSISISGYHIAEAGANPISQAALTLSNGLTYVELFNSRGLDANKFLRNFSWFFSNGMDPEYAVIGRVCRRIWAIAMRDMYGVDERGQKLKYHIQSSGRSLHAQEYTWNDYRTTLQALYALADNANSLHTNSRDEAFGTPTEDTVRDAVAIQLILSKEYGWLQNENPLQGSHVADWLTDSVEEEILKIFEEMHRRGGVLGSLEVNYQRNRIQDESMIYEHRKHSGELPIIGVVSCSFFFV